MPRIVNAAGCCVALQGFLGTTPCAVDPGDTVWVVVSAVLVLGMMPALAFFEAGLLREKNTVSVNAAPSQRRQRTLHPFYNAHAHPPALLHPVTTTRMRRQRNAH